MSNKALWDQATHTLTVIGQQEPTLADIRTLHDGYLSALVQRIKRGSMVPLGEFRKSIGLGVLERLPLEIFIPALTGPFDPKDKFNVDISDAAVIKISGLSSNFQSWMLTGIVDARGGYQLKAHTLTGDAIDEDILQDAEQDDVDTDTDPAAIHYLVSQQPKGEEGTLLNDGRANIFYVLRKVEEQGKTRSVRRVVFVPWLDGGWYFGADPIPHVCRWGAGVRVFFRKRLDTVSV